MKNTNNTNVADFMQNNTISLSQLNKKEYLSVEFHEDFGKIFGISVNDVKNDIPNVNYIRPGIFDKKYLSLLFLYANRSTWENISMNDFYKLSEDLSDFEHSFDEIIRYFHDKNFTRDKFSDNFLGIKNYIADKFPKTEKVIEETRKKIF